jgi:flagellar biosynthesis chaperone FliJ
MADTGYSGFSDEQLKTEKRYREKNISTWESEVSKAQSKLNADKAELENIRAERARIDSDIERGLASGDDRIRYRELGDQISDLREDIEADEKELQDAKDQLQFNKDKLKDCETEIAKRGREQSETGASEATDDSDSESSGESNSSESSNNQSNSGASNGDTSEYSTKEKPVGSRVEGSTSGANPTDPQVIFDPIFKVNPIVRKYYGVSYNYNKTEDDMYSNVSNKYNTLKIDAVEYPLIVINTQTIEQRDVLYMGLKLKGFLPTIELTIRDVKQVEQKIQTSQMNGSIEVCISSRIDKLYKNIRIHFRISNVTINPLNPQQVTYTGYYDIEKFRQVNTGFLKKDQTKANFYELLYVIAQNCGLGFAATDNTEDVEDRCLRNIFTQRYDEYIEQQLNFAGCDEDSILDAWVDPYNYIVLTNVSWVMNKEVDPNEYSIVAICGYPSTDRDVPDPKPKEVSRVLTNFNRMYEPTNMMIKSYSMIINNNAVSSGTLERIYTINWNSSNVTLLDTTDIQTKQNSVDGEYLDEYNTGHNRPLPRFNFNDDDYDLNTQKIIREHYFNKHRQQMLKLKLLHPNLGLQRGTLVSVSIWEQDPQLKEKMIAQANNLNGDESWEKPEMSKKDPYYLTDYDIVENEGLQMMNFKLSDLYYIDSILFEYSSEVGEIEETLFLIKKGKVSGYDNYHSRPKIKSY